jgi:TPR repeat protein
MDEQDLAAPAGRLRDRAEDGDPEAMFLLGVAHAQGKGAKLDDMTAVRWFRQAARKGHARAKTSLGYLHAIGRSVPRDRALARALLAEAEAAGDPLARDLLARMGAT